MMRIKAARGAVFAVAVLVSSCQDLSTPVMTEVPSHHPTQSARLQLSPGQLASLEIRLQNAVEVRRLLEIRNSLTSRARQRGISPEMVRAAYASGNEKEAADLLKLSPAEVRTLRAELDRLREGLYKEFPEVRAINEGKVLAPGSCGSEALAQQLSADPSLDVSPLYMSPGEGESCQWLQYAAALAVCTTAGPILYWPCAYIALCSFCEGGAASLCY